MAESDHLIGALWDLFTADIATGQAVYFCFSQETVKGALLRAGIAGDSPLKAICDAARDCFDIGGKGVILRPGALAERACGRSMAIVLVCQQVLAVEEMVNDGCVSEHAYFPRLRRLMSSDLPLLSQTPFGRGDFLQIWRTFKREVERCDGSTSDTVTFEFGLYTGNNATRGFPFSQALLSRADLSELAQHVRRPKVLSERLGEAWQEIRRNHRFLSRRAQRLVAEGFLHEEMLDQVRRFLERALPSTAKPGKQVSQSKWLELGIGVDPDDFFSEQYRAFVQRKGTSTPIDDDVAIREKLSQLLPESAYIFCPLSETEDYWAFQERDVEVTAGQSFLVVARGHGIQRARAVLDGLTPSLAVPEEIVRSLGHSPDIRVCRIELPRDGNSALRVRAGRIVQNDTVGQAAVAYEWLGGACVDIRSRQYLREALPHAIRFGAREFAIGDFVRVGDRTTSWDGFEKRLAALETNAKYDLHYPNGKIAQLSVATLPRIAPERMGFLINGDGTISPRLQRVDEQDRALIGYSEPPNVAHAASTAELAAFVRDIRDHRRCCYSAGECQRIWQRVEASSAPSTLKHLIREFLARSDPGRP